MRELCCQLSRAVVLFYPFLLAFLPEHARIYSYAAAAASTYFRFLSAPTNTHTFAHGEFSFSSIFVRQSSSRGRRLGRSLRASLSTPSRRLTAASFRFIYSALDVVVHTRYASLATVQCFHLSHHPDILDIFRVL